VPSVASCRHVSATHPWARAPNVSRKNAYQAQRPCPPRVSACASLASTARSAAIGLVLASPHPLHGYTTSSWSSGDSGYPPGDSMTPQGSRCYAGRWRSTSSADGEGAELDGWGRHRHSASADETQSQRKACRR
jgi:hypothetical protein